jgi:hypothetical protein
MAHRAWCAGVLALVAGCDLVGTDGSGSIAGNWGGAAATLTVSHDSTFWRYECLVGILPLSIRLSPDGSFLAQGAVTGAAFRGQPLRLYGAVQADSMQLYYQIQDVNGTWAAPGTSLLIRGRAETDSDFLCID